MREQFLALACGAPAGLRPVVVDDGDDVDEAAALHRIVHQMRVRAEPELHVGRAEFLLDGVRRDERAPGGALAELRRRLPEPGAQRPTTARRRRSARCRARRRRRRRAGRRRSSPLACRTKSSTRVPSRSVMSGLARTASEQRRLQVGAVDHPIGRAVAALGLGAERDAREPAAARGLDRDRLAARTRRRAAARRGRARSGCAWRWAKAGCRRRSLPAARPAPAM